MVFFTRDYYIGHPDDDGDEFERKMNEILRKDDVSKLHKYLEVFDDNDHYPALLDMCLDRLSTNCALHIIQGKLPHGPPMLAVDHCGPQPKLPVLYNVIHVMCEPEVFQLLLTDCQAVSQVNRPLQRLLPIHWLLDLLVKIHPLSHWSPRQPLSTLIDSLYLPEVRTKLKCAQMLAQHTHSLDQIALGFIQNDEIIHLSALLLVAPFTSGHFEIIKRCTNIKSIASQAIHGQSITPATSCAAVLLYLFEKHGNKLTSEFNNPQEESTQAVKGDQSIKRLAQVSKGDRSFPNHSILQIGNFIDFVRRLFSKSSQMTDRTSKNEMMCHDDADGIRGLFGPDANLSPDHYALLHSLLKGREGNDTFRLLQANLFCVNEEVLHSQDGLPALISAIHAFCNNKDNAMENFKSCYARDVNLNMRLLHFVLSTLSKYDYLSKWSLGQSLVKLIILLFLQHELKPTLECAQLIAERINSVNEVAWKLIQQRELVQLAGLLLVAHKKAMEPFVSGDTIKEATSMEYVSQVCHGGSTAAPMGAAGLFEIFEVAGDALAKYWSTPNDEHEPAGVIVEVAKIIQHAGIQVLSTDVDLTDIYSNSSHPEMSKSICERLGIKIEETSGLSQVSRKSPFPSVKSVKERCQPEVLRRIYPWELTTQSWETSVKVPRSQGLGNLGSRAFSTSSCIVDRVKHSSAWASPLVRDLGYLAMKLKRGVRLL